jgi:hypothetical protein
MQDGGTDHATEAVFTMKISAVRSILYQAAKVLGDVQAVKSHKVGQRIVHRVAGRIAGHLLRKLFR